MRKHYHAQLTRAALGDRFGQEALAAVITANLGQDALLNLLRSRFHFDANAFEEAFEYVQEQGRLIQESAGREEWEAAWAAFGRLTHAVQDYYAHTNYAALWRERYPHHALPADGPVDPIDPDILDSPGLIAARVVYPLEALTVFPALVPLLRRILPPDSHANMNLDEPSRGPLFAVAMSAAEQRTRIEFDKICARIASRGGERAVRAFLGLT